jgi:hypothetical protein
MVEITTVMMILFFVRIQKSTAEQMQLASQKSTADQKEATFNGIKNLTLWLKNYHLSQERVSM